MSDVLEASTRDGHAPPQPSVSIATEMRRSYLDYAMSVIVSRAIPDLRDGLKPVHRRILFAMQEGGYLWNRPYRKSARIVGDVIGRYHPHGDAAVYDALVRMAQAFSMRLPLLDGQGNFGSLDGDAPAAMRYTEIRMARAASAMLADIDLETVDFRPNYDSQDEEPIVLPARIPNLLVNGAEGIAVGMATRIPPHNLGEIVDAALAVIENPGIGIDGLMEYIPGPDFPTGGQIVGRSGIRSMYHLGQGSVPIRATTRIEELQGGRAAIIVEEVPFQVNKANLVEEIARLARDKQIEGISEVRDESDRHGVRIAIDLKRDATPVVVRNQLHRHTRLQTSFGANLIALIGRRPERFNLKTYFSEFLAFREEVVNRRTSHELAKARNRAHILCGLAVAVENIDEVVGIIRNAPDSEAARNALRSREWEAHRIESYLKLIDDPEQRIVSVGDVIQLSESQVRAVLELRLNRLTGLGREEITGELKELGSKISEYLRILASRELMLEIVANELRQVREDHATPRRTEILDLEGEVEDEALIEQEEMVVTVTHAGYVKRTPVEDFRAQRRGGKGLAGMSTKEEDFVASHFAADTHTPVLVFATDGRVYKLKVWRFPLGQRTGRGKAVINLLPIESGVSISTMIPVTFPEERWDSVQIVFVTTSGRVRRNELSDFTNVRANGKIAMRVEEGIRLVDAKICELDNDLLLTSRQGKSVRFPVSELRVFASRNSMGVRGMRLEEGDEVVSMAVLPRSECTISEARAYLTERRAAEGGSTSELQRLAEHERTILFVDSAGSGKRVSSYEFRPMHRGGRGVRSMALGMEPGGDSFRTVVAAFPVDEADELMLVTDSGQAIRCPVDGISLRSRTAGGVWLLRTEAEERVVSVARIADVGENGDNGTDQ